MVNIDTIAYGIDMYDKIFVILLEIFILENIVCSMQSYFYWGVFVRAKE